MGAKRSEFAELLGRTYQTVKDIEDGKSDIKVEHIKKLSETFNLNPSWLITGQGSQLIDQNSDPSQGTFIAGRSDLSELLNAICQTLPPDQRHLCEGLKEAMHAIVKENDLLKAKNMQMLEDLNNLLKKL